MPEVGSDRVGGAQVSVTMAGMILLGQRVVDRLIDLDIGDRQPFALGDRLQGQLEPNLLHRLGALFRLEHLEGGVGVLEVPIYLHALLLQARLQFTDSA